jgi:Tol biopolymer transport system component
MKSNVSNLLKFLMWVGVLFMGGCFPFGSINTQTFNPISANTLVSPVAVTPTLLPFIGKIAFIIFDKVMANNQIYIMNANGSEVTNITPPNLPVINHLSWSPNGQYIAFDAYKDDTFQIFKIKSDGSNLIQLTFREEDSFLPSWSPDGESIMFTSSSQDIRGDNGSPVQQIYIIKSDGSETHRFVVKTKAENTPMEGSYQNNGFISVSEQITRHSDTYYIVNLDGVIQKQFPEFSTDSSPVWSSDGKFILLSTLRTDCSGIVIMKFDSLEEKCLIIGERTNPPVHAGSASWSPDGKYIIFSTNVENNNGVGNIYAMRPDGTELTRLTYFSKSGAGGAVWSSSP